MVEEHWEKVYKTKVESQMSWTQGFPSAVMNYIDRINLKLSASIIDIGGGSGELVDVLLEKGFINITVLDISEAALNKSKDRLGSMADKISWIVADINSFKPVTKYDFWYDRAVFHFLTDPDEISSYVKLVSHSVKSGGHFLLGTFSLNGPLKCSGLEITQYDQAKMHNLFQQSLQLDKCFIENHITPFNTKQEFQFCGFKKN